MKSSLAGKRVTVMGLGRFGGGVGAARYLAEQEALVTVTDLQCETDLQESLSRLDGVPLHTLHLGGHVEQDFEDADLIVVSPAVRPNNPFVQLARRHRIPITTEVGLLLARHPQRVVAVTGTTGKSTTTTLIASLWNAAGRRSWLGGNLGGSLLPVIDNIADDDWLILELSSFQLALLDEQRWSPEIAVVTNFAPNHLDWHGDTEHYRRAKQTILRWQRPDDWAVLADDRHDVSQWMTLGRRLNFGTETDPEGNRIWWDEAAIHVCFEGQTTTIRVDRGAPLRGDHQRQNIAAAIGTAVVSGMGQEEIEAGLTWFRPLPHRLECLGERDGRTFYNDSKATTPEAAVAALMTFDQPIVLLAGGASKGSDLSSLAAAISTRTKAVALMGETGPELSRLVDLARREQGRESGPRHRVCGDFPEAVRWAISQSSPGDVILLSPGCASFGWFRDYADRGDQFRRLIEMAGSLTLS